MVAVYCATRASVCLVSLDHTDADPGSPQVPDARNPAVVPGFARRCLPTCRSRPANLPAPRARCGFLLKKVLERLSTARGGARDYHHLGADTPVHAVLDRLLAYLPDVLHVMCVREMLRFHWPVRPNAASISDRADYCSRTTRHAAVSQNIDWSHTEQWRNTANARTGGYRFALVNSWPSGFSWRAL